MATATDLSESASLPMGQDDGLRQPTVNGDHSMVDASVEHLDTTNNDSFLENGTLHTEVATINIKDAASTEAPPDPSIPAPIEDVAPGIQPIADFIPKDVPTLSHPTPPPEQPVVLAGADVDATMEDAGKDLFAAPQLAPEPVLSSESSLVRPREDDEDDEHEDGRATKRSRVDDETLGDATFPEAVINEAAPAQQVVPPDLPGSQGETTGSLGEAPAPAQHLSPAETAHSTPAPALESAATASVASQGQTMVPVDAPNVAEPPAQKEPSSVPAAIPQPAQPAEPSVKPSIESQPVPAKATEVAQAKYSTAPLTSAQKGSLLEKVKNLKKTKSSLNFLRPVDPVALGIPTYLDVIKRPMDLGTMERKLKDNQYESVQAFVNDFDLVVQNTRTFNGELHAVTSAAMNMDAYFKKMLDKVPGPEARLQEKPVKRASPAVKAPPRRESRAPAVAASPVETFALQADGVPQIRRDSTMNRPARAIKPPANREIPYAKPKRKEHQLELRFCEHVLDEVRSPRYAPSNTVFLQPVDPVALNIPNYRQIIKNPMDMTTMAQKLKQGQYGSAKEFRKDFELMIENCLIFNPVGNPVRDFGVHMRRQFEHIWGGKEKWERSHKPESQRATSASDDEDGGEEDEDEDDEPEDSKEQTIQVLQKQLADMQNLISGMASGSTKSAKSKKSKTKSSGSSSMHKKMASVPAPHRPQPAPPAKAKKSGKPKQVTYYEKQEISDAVDRMNEDQVTELTAIITNNCTKYANMEEMELEIDELPNNVQALLLKYVRKEFGKPQSAVAADSPPDDGAFEDDGEFAPRVSGSGAAGKRKKHKPMGKREQQDTISALKGKLAQFDGSKPVGTSGSESPNNFAHHAAKAESSGDDESEESEEE